MKLTSRLLAATLLSLAAGCQGENDGTQAQAPLKAQEVKAEAEAEAEARCVERFEGIQSCATGNARLVASEEGVEVSGITDPKRDGITSHFDGVIGWTQQMSIPSGGDKSRFFLAARNGEQEASTLTVTPGDEPNQLVLQPTFSGAAEDSQFRVNVYQDGVLQGSTQGPSLRYIIYIFIDRFQPWWAFEISRSLDPTGPVQPGACVWRMSTQDTTFTLLTDDGEEIQGNQLELAEEIGDGHYPYASFSDVDVTGPKEFTILSESIRRE